MATRVEVLLSCDICESSDLVKTHSLGMDGAKVEAEACDPCWERVSAVVTPLVKAGRSEKKPRKRT